MPRDIPVGNGSLLITFDSDYCLRDIFFPRTGGENHTDGRRCRFGIWCEGRFSWIDNNNWDLALAYQEQSLMTEVRAVNKGLALELVCNDLVDSIETMYLKKVRIVNRLGREREVRLFFHLDVNIGGVEANTAYFDPDEKAVIHYKGKRYFLASGMKGAVQGIDGYATGIKEFHGFEGTWRDAEDGKLEGNPIAQGSVDSTLSLCVTVPPSEMQTVYYWICAGEDYGSVRRLNKMIQGHGIDHFIRRTAHYWKAWLNKENAGLENIPGAMLGLYRKSLLILQTNIDNGGAIVAGNDSDVHLFARDTYSYMWPRDGALTAYALDTAGYQGISRQFFRFCFDIIRGGKESLGGYFLHKYNPDGSLGSSWHPWTSGGAKILPIQEDGTALVIWSLWRHFDRFRDIEFIVRLYEQMIIRCGDFLASYRDDATGLPLPSYDLWEEKWGVHTFTAAAVYGGIKAAEHFAEFFGDAKRKRMYARAAAEVREAIGTYLFSPEHKRFLKTIVPRANGSFSKDLSVDASMFALFYFGVFAPDDERVESTMQAIRDRLRVRTGVGGIARYEGDPFYRMSDNAAEVPGNPWFICTIWLAQWHIAKAKDRSDLGEAMAILEWVASHALRSGVLAEQIHPYTHAPLSVSPLTWSHASFVAAVQEYREKSRFISARRREKVYA